MGWSVKRKNEIRKIRALAEEMKSIVIDIRNKSKQLKSIEYDRRRTFQNSLERERGY